MSKHDLLWAFVKALGIYMLADGIARRVPTLITALAEGKLETHAWELYANLMYAAIGAYLLFDGSWLLRVAGRPNPSSTEGPQEPDHDADETT